MVNFTATRLNEIIRCYHKNIPKKKSSGFILEMICWKTIGRSPMVSPFLWPTDLIRHPTSPVTTLFCASRPVSGTAWTVKSWGTTASVHGLWHQWTNAGFNCSSKVWFLRKETYLKMGIYTTYISGWWLLLTPLKNHGVKVSWDDDIANIWKVIKHVPNHQPVNNGL